MLPTELEAEILNLPDTDNHTIVLVTSNSLRHKRFAYRMQQEFGDLVVAWYEFSNESSPNSKIHSTPKNNSFGSRIQKIQEYLNAHGIKGTAKKVISVATEKLNPFKGEHDALEEESLFLKEEVDFLKKYQKLDPVQISSSSVHSSKFIEEIKELDPYFFLTLGGPLYKKPILDSIRGAAINQHAGHSPTYKGSNTIMWALYHRSLQHVSSTVHLTTTGADAGQILRRSSPCIFPNDSAYTIFLRTVSLGTELMIESVQEIIENKELTVFKQPTRSGKTYLNREFDPRVAKAIARDFKANWLQNELNKQRNF